MNCLYFQVPQIGGLEAVAMMSPHGCFRKIVGFPPKSSILIGFSIASHPFWGTPIFGNTHIIKENLCFSMKQSVYKFLCCLGGGNSNIFYFHPEIWGRWTHFDSYSSDGLKPPTSCCLVSVAVSLVLSGIWMFKKPFANEKSDDDKVPFLDIQMGLLDIHVFFSRKPPYSLVTSWSLITIAHHWLISP